MGAADRVRKLAALAGSDNEFEANSAARHACRLIREGKVAITEPAGSAHAYTRAEPARPPPRGPFVRQPGVWRAACAACGEAIPAGDAFACADGHVHGDCVPPGARA